MHCIKDISVYEPFFVFMAIGGFSNGQKTDL